MRRRESQILMVGQLGRPSTIFVEELVAAVPEVKLALSGDGTTPCGGFFNPDGELIEENFDFLAEIIEDYEAEQQRRCDAVAQCRTDGGVRAGYVDVLENFSADWNHLNVHGQARGGRTRLARRRGHTRTRGPLRGRGVINRTRKLTLRTTRQSVDGVGTATDSAYDSSRSRPT